MTDEPPELARGGDIYSKTLSLLRRILVGNGYKLDGVILEQLESADYKIPGRLQLELDVTQTMQKIAGPARGAESRVFRDRVEEERYLGSLREQIAATSWLEDVRSQVASLPGGGWGLEQGRWDLPKLSQRVALQLVCDICIGTGNENCLTCYGRREMECQTCTGHGAINCHTCYGNGADPADPSRPCTTCGGRRQITCHTCHGRRFVMCITCRGMGVTQCRECQGLKFKTEETLVKVSASGSFVLGDIGKAPQPVCTLVDELGAQGLMDGHALVAPAGVAANTLLYTASMPYAKMQLTLAGKPEYVHVVGMTPVLIDFPKLLDDVFDPVIKQMSAVSLMSLSRKYRLIRELCEALARGIKPAHFYTRYYPYGISVRCAFALADALKTVFKSISLIPRLLTGGLGLLGATGAYFWWLSQLRPSFLPPQVPTYVWDIGLAALLAGGLWLAIAFAGKQALERLIPTPVSLRAASSRVGLVFTLALIVLMVALLTWGQTQPDWVSRLLK